MVEEKLFSTEEAWQSSVSELKRSRKSVDMAEEKLFSRVLTKDASTAECRNSSNSFRVYYGRVSAGVPFKWESQPGTPKLKFSDNCIPPLTPPPSYYCTRKSHKFMEKKNSTRLNLWRSLFPQLRTRPEKLYVISKSSYSSVSSPSASTVSRCSSPTDFMSPKFQYSQNGGVVGSKSKNLFRCFVGRFLSPSLPGGECQERIEVHAWPCLSPTCC